MSEPIRVLQAFLANDKGGLTGYICQNYRYIDRSKIQFDFLTYDKKLDFEDEFQKMGARFYHISRASNPFKMFRDLLKIKKESNYKIVHYNTSYANLVPIIVFWLLGIKNIIVHSHSTQIDDNRCYIRLLKTALNYLFRIFLPVITAKFYACSSDAGKWCFGKRKFKILHNAIEIEKFIYDETTRNIVRKNLNINKNCFVIGHIGRFSYQKNHSFLIDVFNEFVKRRPNSILLLLGEYDSKQELFIEVKDKIQKYGLDDKVKILGFRNDAVDIMQAMDCFVLPSRFEGLPIVGIEAQTSGLICMFSDVITEEVAITKLVHFNSLQIPPSQWAKTIVEHSADIRKDMQTDIREAGYEQREAIKKIEMLYFKILW